MRRRIVVLVVVAGLVALGAPLARAQSVDKVKEMMAFVNGQLQARGAAVRLAVAEFYNASHQAGQTVYFDDRTHQLGAHWVPGDPYRYGVNDIYWLSEALEGTANGVSFENTQNAVAYAMNTWNTQGCGVIPLVQLPDLGIDLGYVQYLVGMGGFPGWYADITHAGWLPPAFFDIIGGGWQAQVNTLTGIKINDNEFYDNPFQGDHAHEIYLDVTVNSEIKRNDITNNGAGHPINAGRR